MMNKTELGVKLLLIIVFIFMLFSMTSCQSMLDSLDNNEALATAYVDKIIAGDSEGAYALLSTSIPKDEHDTFFASIKETFGAAKEYTIAVTGVRYSATEDGKSYSLSAYQVETDNDKIIQVTIAVLDDAPGEIYNLNIRDSAAFIESTADLLIPNIVLVAFSLFSLVFTCMMIYDCAKRQGIKNKVLWIFICILGLMLTLNFGANSISFDFMISIPLIFSGVTTNIPTETISFNLVLPLGAIIYVFMRKKLLRDGNSNTNDSTN